MGNLIKERKITKRVSVGLSGWLNFGFGKEDWNVGMLLGFKLSSNNVYDEECYYIALTGREYRLTVSLIFFDVCFYAHIKRKSIGIDCETY